MHQRTAININEAFPMIKIHPTLLFATAALVFALSARAQTNPPTQTPVLHVDAGKVTAKVSPMLYGLMTEQINFAYEG